MLRRGFLAAVGATVAPLLMATQTAMRDVDREAEVLWLGLDVMTYDHQVEYAQCLDELDPPLANALRKIIVDVTVTSWETPKEQCQRLHKELAQRVYGPRTIRGIDVRRPVSWRRPDDKIDAQLKARLGDRYVEPARLVVCEFTARVHALIQTRHGAVVAPWPIEYAKLGI